MTWTLWVLAALCLLLTAALGLALKRIYRLQAGRPEDQRRSGGSLEFP